MKIFYWIIEIIAWLSAGLFGWVIVQVQDAWFDRFMVASIAMSVIVICICHLEREEIYP